MPQEVIEQDQNDTNEESQPQIEQTSPSSFSDYLKNNIQIVIIAAIVAVMALLIVTNLLSSAISYMVARRYIEEKFLIQNGMTKAGKYMGPIYDLGEEEYNLEYRNKPIYLKTHMFIELENNELIGEVMEKSSRIQNIIGEIITNKPPEKFIAAYGMQTARRLILESINKILESGQVVDIYITEYLIEEIKK